MAAQRPEIYGVYRFEFTVAGDYYAVEALVSETRARLLKLDGKLTHRWEKLENGKPVFYEWPADDA